MKKALKKIHSRHKIVWTKDNVKSLAVSVGFFIVALIALKISNNYVVSIKGTAVDDLFLNHLPTVDIDEFIIQASLLVTFLGTFLVLSKPKYLNFGLKALAVFIITRAFFISLTHLGPSPHELLFTDKNTWGFWLYNVMYNTKNDFFFSQHTGIPILTALIFWPEKPWRYFFLLTSVVFGASVLLARIHYSIDVFAAPFITYSIYAFCRYFFAKDYNTSRKLET